MITVIFIGGDEGCCERPIAAMLYDFELRISRGNGKTKAICK